MTLASSTRCRPMDVLLGDALRTANPFPHSESNDVIELNEKKVFVSLLFRARRKSTVYLFIHLTHNKPLLSTLTRRSKSENRFPAAGRL